MILQLLSEQDMYGYMIIGQIESRSDSVFHMSEGSLYPILHTMEKEGLLQSYRQMSESGKERKYYRITAKGRLQLELKLDEWKLFSCSVSKVLEQHE